MTVKPVLRSDMTIEEICVAGNQYIESEWKTLYDAMLDELTTAFREIEDAAYGRYLDQLMPALFDSLEDAGFIAAEPLKEHDFVIGKCLIFRNSLEKWGTEDKRSRIFWNVIRRKDGQQPIGTLLTEIPHSHLKFDIPRAPVLYSLREHEREQIAKGIRRIME
ncbi:MULTISPECIES: DUF6022 family protein [Paenibacillus]|uniref:Uncharacterized protein n=2 Tax=Paenibacillus lactis TaxID=228574 RepID=G4HC01_9BACL|nr:DUF6022 family protein [Paenibacillus lactis]EHB66682.1 hypothetical protein PaelaDRAFT_0906 [Paenibacillus lactis 154]MBP1893815.1 hypothetical protein [Paenibacillus lactis]